MWSFYCFSKFALSSVLSDETVLLAPKLPGCHGCQIARLSRVSMQIHAERDIVISVLSVGLSVCLSIAGTVDIIVTLFDVLVGESLVFQPDGRNKIPRGTLPQLGHRMYEDGFFLQISRFI